MSFPAPSDTAIETSLDLNQLVKNPPATFFMRVTGAGMVADDSRQGMMVTRCFASRDRIGGDETSNRDSYESIS